MASASWSRPRIERIDEPPECARFRHHIRKKSGELKIRFRENQQKHTEDKKHCDRCCAEKAPDGIGPSLIKQADDDEPRKRVNQHEHRHKRELCRQPWRPDLARKNKGGATSHRHESSGRHEDDISEADEPLEAEKRLPLARLPALHIKAGQAHEPRHPDGNGSNVDDFEPEDRHSTTSPAPRFRKAPKGTMRDKAGSSATSGTGRSGGLASGT